MRVVGFVGALALGCVMGVIGCQTPSGTTDPATLLSEYLRVDTVNPPGHEGRGARFWQAYFARYGIESEIFPLPDSADRACLVARVRGSGEARPLLLTNHMDVVPFNASGWKHAPLGGVIENGIVYGRGAFDMKATGVSQALVMVAAKTRGWALRRDLVFLATFNEEGPLDASRGAPNGMEWFLERHGQALGNPEFALNEGGFIVMEDGKRARWEVSPAERGRHELGLRIAKGGDPFAWARAATRVLEEFNASPGADARGEFTAALTMINGTGKANTAPARAWMRLMTRGGGGGASVREMLERAIRPVVATITVTERDGGVEALVETSGTAAHASTVKLGATSTEALARALAALGNRKAVGGAAIFVEAMGVESEAVREGAMDGAELVFDFRAPPGVTGDEVDRRVEAIARGFGVEMTRREALVASGRSEVEGPLMDAIRAAHGYFERDARPVPPIVTPVLTSTTDSAYLRQRGIVTYGFDPIPLHWSDDASHGDDERMPVASVRFAAAVTQYVAQKLTTGEVRREWFSDPALMEAR